MSATDDYRLLTLGPSHYCEKARWALDRMGVSYREERHMPLLHWAANLRAGAGRTVPALVTPRGTLGDSTAILLFLDEQHGADSPWRPYPTDAGLRGQVIALEDHFDEQLGPATRRVVYHELRGQDALLTEALGQGVGTLERRLFGALGRWPLALVRWATGARADRAARALDRIEGIFAEVSRRVPGGEGYLLGDRFTAADLTFAALAGPVLFYDQPGASWMPAVEQLPPSLRAIVGRLRATDAGRYVGRLYAEERLPIQAPAGPP